MRIPNYEELILETHFKDEIVKKLLESKIGSAPYFCNLNNFRKYETEIIIQEIQDFFDEQSVDPRFPYPFYIITPFAIGSKTVPIVKDLKKIPTHFYVKSSMLKKNELVLLGKISVLKDKIFNESIHKKIELLKTSLKENKKLLKICTEKAYYLEVQDHLDSMEQKK